MPGVIYIQSVPPMFTVKHLREIMSRFGELGRVYLQAEKRGPHKRKRYTEGWVEFKSKKCAKEVAQMLNGNQVGGRKRSAAYDSVWTMKYLHSFKWEHLMEQLSYENVLNNNVEKGERLQKLEERVLKKSGLWKRYLMQHHQKKVINENKLEKSKQLSGEKDFLQMIFGGKGENEKEVGREEEEKEEEIMEEEEEVINEGEKKIEKTNKIIRRRKKKNILVKKNRKIKKHL
uniref:Activator of basal transcription 1 n=1 Tax=Meloidogyne enterolobii TaxID=390850 RepID=A0A6V7XL00_MELEN|nr:unnamed protein product [Meloidogyne enterolobii]